MGLFEKKIKYKIVFLRKEYSTLNIVLVKTLKSPISVIKLNEKKTFMVSYEVPTYVSKMNRLYFIDYESGNQLKFDVIQRELTPEQLDVIVSNKIIEQIAKGVLNNKKQVLMYVLLGILLGGLIAAMIVMQVYQGKINTLYESCANVVIPYGVM